MNCRLAIAGLLLAAGCASTAPVEKREPLPFHIAIAPLAAEDVRTDRKAGSEGDPTKMRLAPDPTWIASFSKKLADALQSHAFVRVTVLDAPSGDPISRDTALLSQAKDAGADLLMRLELSMQPVIREEKNGTFWVNLPLFALGGPFGWWLPDHSYLADVEVSSWFYDPRALAGQPLDAPLGAMRSEIASARGRTDRIDLDFVKRAQGDVGEYFLSIVCPAGFLAVESDDLQKKLLDQVVDQLGPGLSRSVLDQGTVFERGAAPFFLDVGHSGLERDRSGAYVLRGSVLLSPSREIESLGSWKLRVAGAPEVVGSFEGSPAPEKDGNYERYHFEQPLGKVRVGTEVRLEIAAGERATRVRSYTFRVPAEPSS